MVVSERALMAISGGRGQRLRPGVEGLGLGLQARSFMVDFQGLAYTSQKLLKYFRMRSLGAEILSMKVRVV